MSVAEIPQCGKSLYRAAFREPGRCESTDDYSRSCPDREVRSSVYERSSPLVETSDEDYPEEIEDELPDLILLFNSFESYLDRVSSTHTDSRLQRAAIRRRDADFVVFRAQRIEVATPSRIANSTKEEVLESFDGFVEEIVGETAYVRLKSREHGDVLHGEYPASQFASLGIEEQSRFLCTTVKAGESTRVVLQPIPDVPVTDEELRAIEARIDEALPLDDAIEY